MKIRFKSPKQTMTIEQIEQEIGDKLTYPTQSVKGDMDEEKYKNLLKFGCSDIWDEEGHWLHRDCFSGRMIGVCESCNFYPIRKKYNEDNEISNGIETDIIKALNI